MFGRAAITLGIGPHSSFFVFLLVWIQDAGAVFKLRTNIGFVVFFSQMLRTFVQCSSEET